MTPGRGLLPTDLDAAVSKPFGVPAPRSCVRMNITMVPKD